MNRYSSHKIGSNLAGELLEHGWDVTVLDNLSLGRKEFIERYLANPAFKFIKEDLLNIDALTKSIANHDT